MAETSWYAQCCPVAKRPVPKKRRRKKTEAEGGAVVGSGIDGGVWSAPSDASSQRSAAPPMQHHAAGAGLAPYAAVVQPRDLTCGRP
jgi:hypothetical protein